jgi:hypothetical protein
LKDDEIGNRPHAKSRGEAGVRFRVDFEHKSPPLHFASEFVNFRSGHPARAAPRCPKVDQHGYFGGGNDGIEQVFVGLNGCMRWWESGFAFSATAGVG